MFRVRLVSTIRECPLAIDSGDPAAFDFKAVDASRADQNEVDLSPWLSLVACQAE
jgi:hypothetical protein